MSKSFGTASLEAIALRAANKRKTLAGTDSFKVPMDLVKILKKDPDVQVEGEDVVGLTEEQISVKLYNIAGEYFKESGEVAA